MKKSSFIPNKKVSITPVFASSYKQRFWVVSRDMGCHIATMSIVRRGVETVDGKFIAYYVSGLNWAKCIHFKTLGEALKECKKKLKAL